MEHFDVVIVGGGPAGLQMGYFFNNSHMKYVILERHAVGSFFRSYPRNRRLISVNKVHCGDNSLNNVENILRFDWNSLLQDEDEPMLLRDMTDEYYPSADTLVEYLQNFATNYRLNVRSNAHVEVIDKGENVFYIKGTIINKPFVLSCDKVIVASGLRPNRINESFLNIRRDMYKNKLFHYEDVPILEKAMFQNKNIIIIGGGNAAFEIANYFNNIANKITLAGAEKFSYRSHYPGHIRSVNMTIIDSYYLKLNVFLDWTKGPSFREGHLLAYLRSIKDGSIFNHYDFVIYACGFHAYVPFVKHLDVAINSKTGFPILTPFYESTSCDNLFFAGALTQNEDYKHGTSAFIHGFRYNCRFLYQYLSNTIVQREFQKVSDIISHVMHRINHSSALLHRFDFYCDCICITKDRLVYVEQVPRSFTIGCNDVFRKTQHDQMDMDGETCIVQIYLGYDERNPSLTTFTQPTVGNKYSFVEQAVFIHPILCVYKLNGANHEHVFTQHLSEEAFNEFVHEDGHLSIVFRVLNTAVRCRDNLKNLKNCLEEEHLLVSLDFKNDTYSELLH